MGRRKLSKGKIILFLVLVLILLILVITYANLKNTPTWNEVGETLGVNGQNAYSDSVRFFDVGQGDSALLTSGGRNAVIDVGTPEGAENLCRKIKNCGVKDIDIMLISHNHDDHLGGGIKVAEAFKIKNLMLPDISHTDSPTRIIKTVTEDVNGYGGKSYTAKSGAYFNVGDIKVSVLCQYTECSNENERSIVAMAQIYGNKFLFTGDAGKQAENKILKDGINVDCDVLKVGHHGSSGSSTDKFLSAASPDYAVISCGEGNTYKHPHEEALKRLENVGAKVYRTDVNGDIVFFFNGNKLKVKTEK